MPAPFTMRARFRVGPHASAEVATPCLTLADARLAWEACQKMNGLRPDRVLYATVHSRGRRVASLSWSGRLFEAVDHAAGFGSGDARELDDEGRPL